MNGGILMKRLLMWCLFFFFLIGCTGCIGNKQDKKPAEEKETIGQASEKEEKILVLTYGDSIMMGAAETICDLIGAVHYDLKGEDADTMKEDLQDAEYILIGTTKGISELEFTLRNKLKEEELAGKKTALFLINREEETEEYEGKLLEWYPKAELLPTFTMDAKENLLDELGRMNGWLTTIMTYKKIPD